MSRRYALDDTLAQIDALLEGRDYSPWSPVLAAWSRWASYARAGLIV